MTFSPLTKASSKLRLPDFAISVSRQGAKTRQIVLRILLSADYAAERVGIKSGDTVQIMMGDEGTPDWGYLRVVKASAGLKVRLTHSHKAVNRLQITTTAIERLGALREGTLEPEDVTFPKSGGVQFRIPAALLPAKAENAATVEKPRVPHRKGAGAREIVKEPLQAPLPPGHPKRAERPALPIKAADPAHRIVISTPVAEKPIGPIMGG